ncbi:hypothetical protein BCR33DRAFT_713849 [Rhizoclosmatium globosum]|uniref:Uncharacterized protein n=1 Tax=Rhizoclosmatium globosum TaxID=329046 RepID=A0A1Y2CRS3_9FUNG|nr:hypothetical protein BCR33DRAFT_713849 [Rhizoclosmatium globosum]|eukprot:ORY49544.1 hypothetical protein BCR33DRAFT_713849 [Rhizoclosmatium globosum]
MDPPLELHEKRVSLGTVPVREARRASIDSVGFRIPQLFDRRQSAGGSISSSKPQVIAKTSKGNTDDDEEDEEEEEDIEQVKARSDSSEQGSLDGVFNPTKRPSALKANSSVLAPESALNNTSRKSFNGSVTSDTEDSTNLIDPLTGERRRSSHRRSSQQHKRRLSFAVSRDEEEEEDEEEEALVEQLKLDVQRKPSAVPASGTNSVPRISVRTSVAASTRAAPPSRPSATIRPSNKNEVEEEEEDEEENGDGNGENPSTKEDTAKPKPKMASLKPPSDGDGRDGANSSKSTVSVSYSMSHGTLKSHTSSDMTDEGIITKWLQTFEEFKEYIFSTDIYQLLLATYESTRFLIYCYTIVHIGVLATIALILRYAIGSLVSGILYYNLIHAVAGLLGKASFGIGLRAAQLISKEFTARNMIKRGKGVSLASMTNPVPIVKLNAEEGKTLRYIFVFALLLIEATVWFLGIQMEWEPAISHLGSYACIKTIYPHKPDIANISQTLGNFIQGDSDLAMIYNYGLPLGDGVVGGLAAWPLNVPSSSFSIEQYGVAFAVNSVCGNLRLAPNGTENGLTQFHISDMDVWSTMFTMKINVQLPGGSHDWAQFADSDIMQECHVRYIMGDASINFGFVSDEWGGISSGNMQSMRMNDLRLDLYDTENTYFGRVQDALGVNNEYENITSWVIEATTAVFGNASYGTSQGALFCNLFQWATLPDGYYHTDVTWKGMAAAMSIVAHYVLMQYDASAPTTVCEYYGMQGAGVIQCPSYVIALAATSVVICLLAELSQLFWWFLLSGGGEKNDRAAKILESPMQLLYDLRAGGTDLMGEYYSEDHSASAVKAHYDEVLVRFGESRHTRPNPIGMLILGAPSEVMAMSEKRDYY